MRYPNKRWEHRRAEYNELPNSWKGTLPKTTLGTHWKPGLSSKICRNRTSPKTKGSLQRSKPLKKRSRTILQGVNTTRIFFSVAREPQIDIFDLSDDRANLYHALKYRPSVEQMVEKGFLDEDYVYQEESEEEDREFENAYLQYAASYYHQVISLCQS